MAKKAATKSKAAKPAKAAKPKADKPARKVKPAPRTTVAGSNSVDPNQRILARQHRDKYVILKEAQNKANRNMQALGKTIKADGFTMTMIKTMVQLATPEGEEALKMSIANDLLAAQYHGAAIGAQLSLFMEPVREHSGDIAYDEGVQDCMDHKTANPKYDPSVPQHAAYMRGYHEEQERQLKAGIKKLPDDDDGGDKPELITKEQKAAAAKEALAKATANEAANAPVAASPKSDSVTSRSAFKEQQKAKQEAEAVFSKQGAVH